MALPLSYLQSHEPNNSLQTKFAEAKQLSRKKSSNVVKLKNIESLNECIEEVHLIVRLLFGDTIVPGFLDPNNDYGKALLEKIQRVHDFLITQSPREIERLLGGFTVAGDKSMRMACADRIKNYLEQKKEDEPMQKDAIIELFNFFGGKYRETVNGKEKEGTLASRFINMARLRFYTSKQLEDIQDYGVIVTIPLMIQIGDSTGTRTRTQDEITSVLSGVTKIEKMDRGIRKNLSGLDSAIRTIPVISSLLIDIQISKELIKLNKRGEDIAKGIRDINTHMQDNDLNEVQEQQSQKSKKELESELTILGKKIEELRKQKSQNKVVGTVSGVMNEIRVYFGKEKIDLSDDISITTEMLESKKWLLQLLMSSMKEEFILDLLGDKLWEIVIFYDKILSSSIIESEERQKFTPKYITSVFNEVFRKFPQLKTTE